MARSEAHHELSKATARRAQVAPRGPQPKRFVSPQPGGRGMKPYSQKAFGAPWPDGLGTGLETPQSQELLVVTHKETWSPGSSKLLGLKAPQPEELWDPAAVEQGPAVSKMAAPAVTAANVARTIRRSKTVHACIVLLLDEACWKCRTLVTEWLQTDSPT